MQIRIRRVKRIIKGCPRVALIAMSDRVEEFIKFFPEEADILFRKALLKKNEKAVASLFFF